MSRLPGSYFIRIILGGKTPLAVIAISAKLTAMPRFFREKHRIDFLALATRKEKNPWMEKFYVAVGLAFFGYVLYTMFFGE